MVTETGGWTALLNEVRDDLARRGVSAPTPVEIALSVHRVRAGGDAVDRLDIVEEVRGLAREFSGLGELAVPLAEPEVTDVLLNGPGQVWIDRGAGMEPSGLEVTDALRCRQLAVQLATACGVRLDDAHPFADGVLTVLPPGVVARAVRVHVVLDPPSGQGACVSLRALSADHRNLASLQESGMFPPPVGRLLGRFVRGRTSVLVSGGTGAGKTTLLAALLAEVPAQERVLLVEDTPELCPDHPHVVALHTRESGADGAGEIDVRTLVRQSLRMRPDRIVVGEIRGVEIAELLLAFNTGHAGSAGTVHANGVDAVPGRLLALGALAGLPETAVVRQIIDGIGAVIHVERQRAGRRISRIGMFTTRAGTLAVDTVWDASTGPGPAWDAVDHGGPS